MKNQSTKKILKIIGSAFLGAVGGFGFMMLIDNISKDMNLNVFPILAIIILTFYISIALHELGHFFAFIFNKIQMRMLNISIFSFIFDGEKWRLKLNRNNIGVGGIAIPNLTVVSNEKEFKETQEGYANAILAAPIVTLFLALVGILVIFIGFLKYNKNHPYLLITGGTLLLINILLFFSCFIKSENAYGDLRAYSFYKNDDFFAALMIYQYSMFSIDYKNTRVNNRCLREILLKSFEKRANDKKTDLFTISCATTFIDEYLIGIMDELPKSIIDYIHYYYENKNQIIKEQKTEQHRLLLLHIAYYFEKEGEHKKAVDIYDNYIKTLSKSPVFDYWKIQGEQIIFKKDRSKYLLNKKNIKPNSTYSLFKQFDGFYHDELILNQRL
ncbi:site-2 protease family protein [Anaerosalibacter massiliensis]|uniref:Site-2 protease family protein n=1 Tax=Anaerosalibacter massiliensis TaxID=1347392 RepID=A0A9X2MP58_9FIRM|nr:site-2 protease family protein [Anaerosalibacter massiliensis]MCR2044601.1 site-2 protease family protein [Anaerosalibacter massiliensis]